MAGREGVESRLVRRGDPAARRPGRGGTQPRPADQAGTQPWPAGQAGTQPWPAGHGGGTWHVRHGPFPSGRWPALARPGWTLLVQGLDLHVAAAHAMLAPFRFVPAARLDDLMVSWASPGGGVGPHVDSYDVFLLQVQGRRRWRIGPPGDVSFIAGLPLKILGHFEPVHDWVLEPGDMLYLPPGWGHDGVAVGGDCMTCSVGFRAPSMAELERELLVRLSEAAEDRPGSGRLYADAGQPATAATGAVPVPLQRFAQRALARALATPGAAERALGELLSEPKPQVWFEAGQGLPTTAVAVALDARTRMLYDTRHAYINGESLRMGGRDAGLMRRLADQRCLGASDVAALSEEARAVLAQWVEAGWLHAQPRAAEGAGESSAFAGATPRMRRSVE
ncbi:MAG: cupin domain-containing protein [Rubrivivax sp.]|nr:cupin domain-containing protein [Rubrivivax sp.]